MKNNRGTGCLFVYGTLRRNYKHPMAQLLAQHAVHLGKAHMPGRLYRVASYPGAIQDGSESWVVGDVFQLKHPQRLLPKLDRYEGCARGQALHPPFVRRSVEITLAGSESLTAWVYLYNRPVNQLPEIPGGDFLAIRGLARAAAAAKNR